jgi:hypothetical protein
VGEAGSQNNKAFQKLTKQHTSCIYMMTLMIVVTNSSPNSFIYYYFNHKANIKSTTKGVFVLRMISLDWILNEFIDRSEQGLVKK